MQSYESLNEVCVTSETDPFTEERYRQFYRFLPKEVSTVLDVGCNTGRGGRILKALNPNLQIVGLECVKARLERLPQEVYTRTICGYSTEIPAEDNSFDAIIAGEFIEHLYTQDVDKTLAEMFRTLKIGGRLLLTTPNPNDIKLRLRKQSVLGGAHVSQHFPDALKIKLKMMGYSNVKIYGSGKTSRYLGNAFPLLNLYGSYLAIADKR